MIAMQRKRDTFLQLLKDAGLDPKKNGSVVNEFLGVVRSGKTDANIICRKVYAYALERLRDSRSDDDMVKWHTLVEVMKANYDASLDMAEWAVWWEALPDKERQKIKSGNRETFMLGWMENQPPTDKQIEYLTALGCKEIPETRLEASNLIEVYKSRRDRKGW